MQTCHCLAEDEVVSVCLSVSHSSAHSLTHSLTHLLIMVHIYFSVSGDLHNRRLAAKVVREPAAVIKLFGILGPRLVFLLVYDPLTYHTWTIFSSTTLLVTDSH